MNLVRRYIHRYWRQLLLYLALECVIGAAIGVVSAFAFHYYYTITHSMATRYPTADGTTTGWRKSNADSTHWRSVNEVNTKEVPVDFWLWNRIAASSIARVDTVYPNAVGDISEWTASSGTNKWDLVDEVTCSGTDYVYTAASTKTQYFNLSIDTTVIGAQIDSARILGEVYNVDDGGGLGDTVHVMFDTLGADKWVKSVYVARDDFAALTTGPITNLTRAKLATMEIGVKSKTLLGNILQLYCIRLQIFSHAITPTSGDSLAVSCFTDPGIDTTYLLLDSVRFGLRVTHTGAGYKRLIVVADTGAIWNLDTIDAHGKVDTLYVSADGDTNQWVGSTSPNYTNVDERVPSSSDYVSPTLGDPLSEQYRIEGDSAHAATLDSIRILAWLYNPNGSGDTAYVQMRHNVGGWTIIDTAKIPTAYGAIYKVSRAIATPSKAQMVALQIGFTKIVNGVSVRLRWCAVERFFSDNIYHMEYTRPVVNLSKATLYAIQIGVKQIDTCDTGESLKVAQITTQVYTSDIGTYDYARRIYHDSSDFVIGQISNRGGRDDQWGKAFPEVGRTQTQGTGTDSNVTNRAFLVIRNLDSIINAKPGSCPKEYSVDSGFLYLTCTETNNSVNPLQLRQVVPAAPDTSLRAVHLSTGTKVSYVHSNWANYDTAGIGGGALWLLAGVDSTDEYCPPAFEPDTLTLSTGVTSRIDITSWLQEMAATDWEGRRVINGLCLRMTGDNPDSTAPNVFYELANVRPFTSGEEDSSWIEIFTSYVGDPNDPDPGCNTTAGSEGYSTYPWFGADACYTSGTSIDGRAYCGRFIPELGGDIDSIGACTRVTTNPDSLKYAVYSGGGYATKTRVDYTAALNVPTHIDVWYQAPAITKATITASQPYWICASSKGAFGGTTNLRLTGTLIDSALAYLSAVAWPVWPTTLGSPSMDLGQCLSVRVAYHTTGGGATPTGRRRRQIQGEVEPDSTIQYRTIIIDGGRYVDVPTEKADSVITAWGIR